jgi:hypothetical protein
MIRADDKIVCEEYLTFIRSKPCCVCPSTVAEAHHLIHRGWRDAKRNDFSAIPMCRDCHQEYHRLGATEFRISKQTEINLWQVAALLMVEFFLTHDRPEVTVGKRLQGEIE